MSKPARRLQSETFSARLEVPAGKDLTTGEVIIGYHDILITVARNLDDTVAEVAFTGRGKIGAGMDQMLVNLGVVVSRCLQRRDPNTGDPAG